MNKLFTYLVLGILALQMGFPAFVEARSSLFRSGGHGRSQPRQSSSNDHRNRDRGSNWKTAASAAGGAAVGSVVGNALSAPHNNYGPPMHNGQYHGGGYSGDYENTSQYTPQYNGSSNITTVNKPMGFWGFVYSFLKPIFDLIMFLVWVVVFIGIGVAGFVGYKKFSGKVK